MANLPGYCGSDCNFGGGGLAGYFPAPLKVPILPTQLRPPVTRTNPLLSAQVAAPMPILSYAPISIVPVETKGTPMFASCDFCSCSFCDMQPGVQDCTLTGSSCCNVTNSCLSTAPNAPSLGTSGNGSGSAIDGLLSALPGLGVTIGSIVTGRPVVSTPNGGQTLGAKPIVTGQVQANTVLFVIGGVLVVVALVALNRH